MGNQPGSCTHEDWPCCGCGEEASQEEQDEMWEAEQRLADQKQEDVDELEREGEQERELNEDNFTDSEADADTLRSAGWGSDEDYGGGQDIDTPMGDFYGGE